MREKVVGTTYVEQKKVTELVGTLIPKEEGEHGVPEFHTTALLVPEPTNEHDNTAVAVVVQDRKSTRLNSSHIQKSRMPSSA